MALKIPIAAQTYQWDAEKGHFPMKLFPDFVSRPKALGQVRRQDYDHVPVQRPQCHRSQAAAGSGFKHVSQILDSTKGGTVEDPDSLSGPEDEERLEELRVSVNFVRLARGRNIADLFRSDWLRCEYSLQPLQRTISQPEDEISPLTGIPMRPAHVVAQGLTTHPNWFLPQIVQPGETGSIRAIHKDESREFVT